MLVRSIISSPIHSVAEAMVIGSIQTSTIRSPRFNAKCCSAFGIGRTLLDHASTRSSVVSPSKRSETMRTRVSPAKVALPPLKAHSPKPRRTNSNRRSLALGNSTSLDSPPSLVYSTSLAGAAGRREMVLEEGTVLLGLRIATLSPSNREGRRLPIMEVALVVRSLMHLRASQRHLRLQLLRGMATRLRMPPDPLAEHRPRHLRSLVRARRMGVREEEARASLVQNLGSLARSLDSRESPMGMEDMVGMEVGRLEGMGHLVHLASLEDRQVGLGSREQSRMVDSREDLGSLGRSIIPDTDMVMADRASLVRLEGGKGMSRKGRLILFL